MRRRAFLRTAAAVPGTAALSGLADGATPADEQAGIVWSHRERAPGTQELRDVIRRTDGPFLTCGFGQSGDYRRALVRTFDRAGRVEGQRRGPEWGARADTLADAGDLTLLAGLEDGAPLLVTFESLSEVVRRRTFDGAPDGPIELATTGGTHAVGWTESGDTGSAVVVSMDGSGERRWRDQPGDDRLLSDLVATEAATADQSTPLFVAVGTKRQSASGWSTVYRPDGTRERDRRLKTPGLGPETAVADGANVVLAGTSPEAWWLQRRTPDWSIDAIGIYGADGTEFGVDDVVVTQDGYALLAHDEEGAVVIRTDEEGREQWRGRYAPYTGTDGPAETDSTPNSTTDSTPNSTTDSTPNSTADSTPNSTTGTATNQGPGATGADRGHAMVPIRNDQFVIVGTTAPGDEGRDWWTAQVGEPGDIGTADTPTRSPTPRDGGLTTVSENAPRSRTPAVDRTNSTQRSSDGLGSVVWAAVATVGLGGWFVLEYLSE